VVYQTLSVALAASAAASRRRAQRFDNIPFSTLARAYTEQLGRLFANAEDLGFEPSRTLLYACGLRRRDLEGHDDVTSVEAAEQAADRSQVVVQAL
jgi:hypothetical protein